jgi:phage shock protein E
MIRSALVLLLGLAACGPQAEPAAREPARTQAQSPAAQVLYVDVRTPEEFASGHVAGAVNIPHDQMEARWRELAAHQGDSVVVYCRTGRRSGLAIDVLRSRGFDRLENGGGFEQLAAQGVPTER